MFVLDWRLRREKRDCGGGRWGVRGGDRGEGGGIGRYTSYFFINNVIFCVFKCSQAFVRDVRGEGS